MLAALRDSRLDLDQQSTHDTSIRRRVERQGDAKGRAASREVFRRELSAMGLDDGACNRQAHTHALRLGGEKRLEQPLDLVERDAGTGIGDGQAGGNTVTRG